jgi:UDP-3-O-acyl-N-acetylglucosamine deacetylase
MATLTNIFIDQGASFSTSVTIADSDGNAFDLTDYSAQAQIRKTYESITATNFSTTISVNPTTGLITLELTAAQTAALEPGRYVYDLIISSSGGIKTRVVEGIATITPSVSRE